MDLVWLNYLIFYLNEFITLEAIMLHMDLKFIASCLMKIIPLAIESVQLVQWKEYSFRFYFDSLVAIYRMML